MERPTPITLFGVLNFVFGAFGLYGVFATLVMPSVADPNTNQVLELMSHNSES